MAHDPRRREFELLALPHLDAAYNLARWLSGNRADAEDIVQEAYLRGWRYFSGYRGGDMRVWLLAIVRTCFMTWMKDNRSPRLVFFAEEPAGAEAQTAWAASPHDPEALLLDRVDGAIVTQLMARLPGEYREVLLLREVEDFSYQDIAEITGTPIGTVMSRLARARAGLRKLWREAGHAV
jgi:RNA polymerase sigma-70 factor (ECF subfamily)